MLFELEPGQAGRLGDQAAQGIGSRNLNRKLAAAPLHGHEHGKLLTTFIKVAAHRGHHPDAAASGQGIESVDKG